MANSTSNATYSATFDGSSCGEVQSTFNENIAAWNIGNAITTVGMFACTQFNHDISLWNTANIQNMSGMFMFATGTYYFHLYNKDDNCWF
jgi:surface protein